MISNDINILIKVKRFYEVKNNSKLIVLI